ncbi:hypothetical protein B0H10DRAFT_2161254 [Mycena sp. CBHHK59/15]|nr:hypothetical protein B0H10DRAFT_2161254 [Mycena sp. CBHHK59/15]
MSELEVLEVNHLSLWIVPTLPPLLLHIVLPATYPDAAPPDISIRSNHLWLPHTLISRLCGILGEMWRPGDGVLYDWVEFIRGGQFLNALNVVLPSGVIEIHHPAPQRLGPLLTSYDDSARSTSFGQGSYPCLVCLTTVKGSKCLELSCKHVFCRSCLFDYWSLCITEGNVEKLGCPDPECVKIEIARVVPEESVQRWRWLKEKIMFEKDPSLVHCPMEFYRTGSDPRGERLRICPACSFSFCAFCKRTWHGAVQDCPISYAENVVLEYLALAEDSKEHQLMELKYGRIIIGKLVARYEEEQLNKKWLAASTTACPGCAVATEKSLGCNHMTCTKCKTHFCFRCGKKLVPTDPYAHFSTPGHPCYNKLFDFVSEDREWEPF